ncbi:MAG TPA: family 20 glycosylhydrolase, partial [Candidatus Methylacidiphilales bacterium]
RFRPDSICRRLGLHHPRPPFRGHHPHPQPAPSIGRKHLLPERIEHVVQAAQARGLEVIPVVGTLGHAEHHLEGPELRPLLGHGTRYKHLFCPSNESTYERLEDYFTELAALFPGPNFHIGGDESWALGACPACRERLHRGESTEDVSLTHLLHLAEILQRLGKRAWIWDDVFERHSTDKAHRLPRDIVICSWRTGAQAGARPAAASRARRYLDAGFDVVACPWTRSVENIVQARDTFSGDELLGGMITVWNLSTSFWPAFLPGAAFAAKLWSNPVREWDVVLYEALRELLPSLNQESLYGVCGVLSNPFWSLGPSSRYLPGDSGLEERRDLYSFVLYEELLRRALRSLPLGLERSILSELHTQIETQLRTARKHGWTPSSPEFSDLDEPESASEIGLPPAEGNALEIPAPVPGRTHVASAPEGESARPAAQEREAHETPRLGRALLTVRLSLAAADLEPTLHIEVDQGGLWKEIYLGTFRPFNPFVAVYNFQLPLNWKCDAPERLRAVRLDNTVRLVPGVIAGLRRIARPNIDDETTDVRIRAGGGTGTRDHFDELARRHHNLAIGRREDAVVRDLGSHQGDITLVRRRDRGSFLDFNLPGNNAVEGREFPAGAPGANAWNAHQAIVEELLIARGDRRRGALKADIQRAGDETMHVDLAATPYQQIKE